MRTEQQIMQLILDVAKSDERIKAVMMEGSRSNPDAPKDNYQDYDICYYVDDTAPFYGNTTWVTEHFGEALIVQSRDDQYGWEDSDSSYIWLMIFPDGVRIDLSVSGRSVTQ